MTQEKPSYEALEERIRVLEARLSDERTAWDILRVLANAWEADGPPGIVDNRDLVNRLEITANEAIPALQQLVESGVIDKDQRGYASYLTADGYELFKSGTPRRPIADQIRAIRGAHRQQP